MKAASYQVNWRHAFSGISLIMFFIFTEAIPLGGNMAHLPRLFTIQFFVPSLFDSLSVYWLMLPGALFLWFAIQPVRLRPPLFEHCVLLFIGFSFYPIVFIFRAHIHHPYTNEGADALLWALLMPGWIGLILWSRSKDFLWASAAAAPLWDMGAAIRGVMFHVERIGVPYHEGLPPKFVIIIDAMLCASCLFLWWRNVNPLPLAEKLWKKMTGRPSEDWLKT